MGPGPLLILLQAGALITLSSVCPLHPMPKLGPEAFKIIRRYLGFPCPPSSTHLKSPCMDAEVIRTPKGEIHVGGSASEIPNQASGRHRGLRLWIPKSSVSLASLCGHMVSFG